MQVIYIRKKGWFVFMPYLQLKLVSENAADQNSSCRFTQQGGSIGRSNDCDWTLIDTDRYISNKHLVISFQNNNFILTDVSSNGVFINHQAAPLGRNNEHVLKLSDNIDIGKFSIRVELIENDDISAQVPDSSVADDSGLLGLVMGSDSAANEIEAPEPLLKIPDNSQYSSSQPVGNDLGLNDILSGAVTPKLNENTVAKESQFEVPPQDPVPHMSPQKTYETPETPQHYVANDTSIPEDWELSGIMPAISDYKAPEENSVADEIETPVTSEPEIPASSRVEVSNEPLIEENVKTSEKDEDLTPPAAEIPKVVPSPHVETSIEPPIEPIKIQTEIKEEPQEQYSNSSVPSSNNQPTPPVGRAKASTEDEFLYALYTKLGLPKEYLSSIDPDVFADDIVTILLSTTKGLMSLLNSRTVFKQESRLSLTSVQPRSNNPIKFSIDPVDTLEMLLLKKKKGYMSAKDSYDEAVDDIQLHQMAFLSGLQATLVGVLGQLDPDSIEQEVNESSRSFMGLNSSAKCWQQYKDKQQVMVKSVSENLNEILSNYFSEAYQEQINSFKNEK